MKYFTGIEYINIAIANYYGMDKFTWQERLDWVGLNAGSLGSFTPVADEPLLYAKALRAREDALNHIPTGFIMGLDATQSGLQIMSCMIGCEITGSNVNLGPNTERKDFYIKMAAAMSNFSNTAIDRAMMKDPVMTTFYGSIAEPKKVFGADTPELAAYYAALGSEAPGAMEVLADIQGCWQSGALYHEWLMPDGHTAHVKVMQEVDKKIEVDALDHATFTHRMEINEGQDVGISLAANIVHSVDGYVVREMVRRAHAQGFQLLTIHDEFWASPNYMNEVRQNYVDILAEVSDMNLLEDILGQIVGHPITYIKYSDNYSDFVKQSEYALS